MILIDANILLYAEDSLCPLHDRARKWWDARMSEDEPVGFCWPVLGAFIRIGTNKKVFARPLSLDEAVARVQNWLEQPCARMVHPTDKHWAIFQKMLKESGTTGNLVSDAHLAALAIEHECEICSTDADFARFPNLQWRNPLAAQLGKQE